MVDPLGGKSGAVLITGKRGNIMKIISKELFSDDSIELFLQATGNAIITSIKRGYEVSKAPDGNTWPDNPEWWQRIKGHLQPNIGILRGRKTPPQFKANRKHMKDSLRKRIDVSKKQVIIDYEPDVHERAVKTHFGTDKIQKRPHLGFSTWGRHSSGKPDDEAVLDIFYEIISLNMQNLDFGV